MFLNLCRQVEIRVTRIDKQEVDLADTLVSAGYEVLLATSIQEAVIVCQSSQPSVVMIGWDGEENSLRDVSRELKNSLTTCPYVVLMSENMNPEQTQLGLQCGVDDFVFQPTNASELIVRTGIAERILGLKTINQCSVSQITAPQFSKRRRSLARQSV